MKKNTVGSFSLIKRLNTSLILRTIRDKGLISRSEIAKITGLTPATVTNITSQLIKYEIIYEVELGSSSGGRKPILLHMNDDGYHVIGIYIGSKNVEVILSNLNADVIKYDCFPMDLSKDPYDVLNSIAEKILNDFPLNKKVLGAGIGVHGIVDSKLGVSVIAPNLKWENINVKSFYEERLKVPVYVENDVSLMSLGENWFGVAKNESDFVFIYIGYGIGSSIFINGSIYRGHTDGAGEIGHTTVESNGILCSCGNYGCLQTLASESAMLKLANGHLPKGTNIDYIIENKDREPFTSILKNESKYLGIGISNIINTLNPSLVVLNGRITKLGSDFMNEIKKTVKKRSFIYSQNATRIVYSSLGQTASLKGAVALVLHEVFENISSSM